MTAARAGSRRSETFLHDGPDPRPPSRRRPTRPPRPAVRPGRARGTRRAPGRGTRSASRSIRSASGAAGRGDVVGDVEHDRPDPGSRPSVAHALSRSISSTPRPRADALVHERRRDVPVAHHPRAARQRRDGSPRRRAGPGPPPSAAPRPRVDRRRRRRARPRGAPAERGAAGLERLDHVVAASRSRAASSGTWVLFPLPSPPSSTTNRPLIRRLRRSVARRLVRRVGGFGRRRAAVRGMALLHRERAHRPQLVARVEARRDREHGAAPQREPHAGEAVAEPAERDARLARGAG